MKAWLPHPAWSSARDVIAGEDAVNAAAVCYLPRLDSQTDEEYAAYKERAAYIQASPWRTSEPGPRPSVCIRGSSPRQFAFLFEGCPETF